MEENLSKLYQNLIINDTFEKKENIEKIIFIQKKWREIYTNLKKINTLIL